MILDALHHPPAVTVAPEKGKADGLYLVHRFEGKPLVQEYVSNTLMGIEYLWGAPVQLETSIVADIEHPEGNGGPPRISWKRVIYTMQDRKLRRSDATE
jgi:stage V sporulation protein R